MSLWRSILAGVALWLIAASLAFGGYWTGYLQGVAAGGAECESARS